MRPTTVPATVPATDTELAARVADDLAPTPTPDGASPFKRMRLEELMDVEVTSVSRQESTVGQSPAAITVITPEMIRRSGATSIPELFRMVPGMDVARVRNSQWAVSGRGFNSQFGNKLLVQIDGRTLYNPIFSGVYWDTVDYPLEDVERIEVVRGPGGSVWGANAVNGVINIITRSSKETQGLLVGGGVGTAERGFGEVRYGGKLGADAYYRVYGKGLTRDDTGSPTGVEPYDEWSAGHGGFRADWQRDAANAFTLQGDVFRSDAHRTDTVPQFTPPFSLTLPDSEVSKGGDVLARWTHQVDKDSSWSLQVYWDAVERDSADHFTHLRWHTYDVDFQHQFRLGDRHQVVYGLGYRFQDVEIDGSSPDDGFFLAETDRGLNTFSGFVQDQITLVPDQLTLTLGTKLEHNDFTGFEVQPTGRLLWTPTKHQAVWAAISRAVRTPSLLEDELTATFAPAPGSPVFTRLVGNDDFKAEEVLALELGYRTQVTDTLSLDVAVFYNKYDSLSTASLGPIGPGPVPGTGVQPIFVDNRMDGETYGLELAANWRIADGWRLYAAYTFTEIQLHEDGGIAAFSNETAEGQTPQNQVYLQSSFDLPHNLELDVIVRYVDSLPAFNPSTPGYVSLDARLAWHPNRNVELAVVGQNLLDEQHPEFGAPNVAIEIPRGVYAMITYRW